MFPGAKADSQMDDKGFLAVDTEGSLHLTKILHKKQTENKNPQIRLFATQGQLIKTVH